MSGKILLIGATGPTGKQVLEVARNRGIGVRALARNPQALPEGIEAVKGDVLNVGSLRAAMSGVATVVSLLGTPLLLKGPVTLLSEGTRNLVQAMKDTGVSRLICVSGMGAGDSRGHGGFLYDHILLPLLLGRVYADKDRQEQVVRSSGLNWVLVRPAALTNKPAKGTWREISSWSEGDKMTSISRADVADFILREATSPQYKQTAVNLSGS